jgi:[acyl-carrier-protein] S-malonyltransferase
MIKYACVFPGQGSQAVGMLHDLALQNPIVIDLFQSVSQRLGYDVWDLVQHGPLEKLNQTVYTQVAMLVADVAVYKVLNPQPSMLAGHSLGEYAALVCADAIALEDAAELVQYRGQCMQNTVAQGVGAMAAIVGLSDLQVQELCIQASTQDFVVSPANYNAIGQVVIAGHTIAVEKALVLAQDQQARLAKIIPVSVPCHCELLSSAANIFAEKLHSTNFSVPSLPVISNVDLSTYTSVTQMRKLLAEQLYKPVRWVETILNMQQHDIQYVIECGPGKVLNGLVKRIEKSLNVLSVNDPASLDAARLVIKGIVE